MFSTKNNLEWLPQVYDEFKQYENKKSNFKIF